MISVFPAIINEKLLFCLFVKIDEKIDNLSTKIATFVLKKREEEEGLLAEKHLNYFTFIGRLDSLKIETYWVVSLQILFTSTVINSNIAKLHSNCSSCKW